MTKMVTLTVSQLADRVGVRADTVRYYERVGLLPAPARSPAGYRTYGQAAVERLRFIKGAQRVGLRLRDIAELLQVACPCGHTQALLRERLAEVDAELDRPGALRAELARLLDAHPQAACQDPGWAGGGASKSSPKRGGDGDDGLPVLWLSLRQAAMPVLRMSMTLTVSPER
jgi:DNA-binding transcriptional MerR regulator